MGDSLLTVQKWKDKKTQTYKRVRWWGSRRLQRTEHLLDSASSITPQPRCNDWSFQGWRVRSEAPSVSGATVCYSNHREKKKTYFTFPTWEAQCESDAINTEKVIRRYSLSLFNGRVKDSNTELLQLFFWKSSQKGKIWIQDKKLSNN